MAMKFVLKVAICNYYETHGNFNNIEDTVIGQESLSYYKSNNKDLAKSYHDFLYEQLGYKRIGDLSMEDTLKARSLFVNRKNDELKKMLHCNDMNVIRKLFSDNGVTVKSFPKEQPKSFDDLDEIINLLAFYYKHDNSVFVFYKVKTVPLSVRIEEISGMKNGINKKLDLMLNDTCLKNALVNIHYRKNAITHLQNGELFSSRKCSNDEILTVQRESLKKAAFPLGVDLNALFKRSWNLVLLSINNNKAYLNILDYARGNNMTYKELAKYYDINIPDEVPIYTKHHILLYNLSKDLYYTIDPTCTEKTPIIKNTL